MAYRGVNHGLPPGVQTMDMSDSITQRIQEAYAAAKADGLSQAELARRVGVSKQAVGDWLKGRVTEIRPDNLYALADALQVEARWLATGKGSRKGLILTPEQRRMLQSYLRLPPTQQATIRLLVDQIADERDS